MKIIRKVIRAQTLEAFCVEHNLDIVVTYNEATRDYEAGFSKPVAIKGECTDVKADGVDEDSALAYLAQRISCATLRFNGPRSRDFENCAVVYKPSTYGEEA